MSGPVVILYGGPSSERAVSVVTAQAVEKALLTLGTTCHKLELTSNWMVKLPALTPSFVFLALHGSPGEDGTIQGALDLMGLPYNGSGVLASALAMDKPRAKKLFAAAGLDVALERVYTAHTAPEKFAETNLTTPVVVKPASQGSTVGTTLVTSANRWPEAVKNAAAYGTLMVEEYIPGRELTVSVLGEKPLAVTEISSINKANFYDYDAKYASGGSHHKLPANLPEATTRRALEAAATACRALGTSGAARADFRYDEATNRLVILEINTLPGLTPTSLLPEQAAFTGMEFPTLINWMMEEAKCRHTQAA